MPVAEHTLSRRHCAIEPDDEGRTKWAVEDLESLNGTRVGAMYVGRRVLQDGDEVTIGSARIAFHAAGYVGRRPDRPEALLHEDDGCVNEAILRAGPWPQPRMAEPRRLMPEPQWHVPDVVAQPITDSQNATADEGTAPPRQRVHPYGLIAGIAASAATLGAAAVWVLSH